MDMDRFVRHTQEVFLYRLESLLVSLLPILSDKLLNFNAMIAINIGFCMLFVALQVDLLAFGEELINELPCL